MRFVRAFLQLSPLTTRCSIFLTSTSC
jgi:hypothetical protein